MFEKEKIAIVVGSNGQDGHLLLEELLSLNYKAVGIGKNDLDITNSGEVYDLINMLKPDEIYFLAAYHHSSEDFFENGAELYYKSIQVNSVAVVNFLETISNHLPTCKFFYASSCLIFPSSEVKKHTELSEYMPMDPYSLSKVTGMMACNYYRNKFGVFASVGILYNHESPLRKSGFVTKKISAAVARIYKEKSGELVLGNLDAIVDWGYAPDYVKAMHAILQLNEPEDFIIATGKEHSIREYVEIAFGHVGLNYLDFVKVNEQSITRQSVKRIGNPRKLKQKTGWNPSISFKDMVCKLVDWELSQTD